LELVQKIKSLIKDPIEKMGYTLVDLKLVKKKSGLFLTVVINKEGGVGIKDCVRVSRKIEPILDKEDLIQERYFLIVSSPGVNE
jgi:ribosome maturation factor RimP